MYVHVHLLHSVNVQETFLMVQRLLYHYFTMGIGNIRLLGHINISEKQHIIQTAAVHFILL